MASYSRNSISRKRAKARQKLLVRARELLARPHGWTKGRMKAETKYGVAYCLVGAVQQAANELGEMTADSRGRIFNRIDGFDAGTIRNDAERVVLHCVTEQRPVYSIPQFNDAESTRKKDVLDAMNCAVEKAVDVTI